MQEFPRYLYRAPFVVSRPETVIEDGAVLTEHGLVVAVGKYSELKGADAKLEEYDGCVLTPALVNCHAHLELSNLAHFGAPQAQPEPGDITGWISKLLAARASDHDGEACKDAAVFALAKLYGGGCRAVADIGNLAASRLFGQGFKTEVYFFLEMLGLGPDSEKAALRALAEMDEDFCCTAHAPYSTSPGLIRALKKRANDFGRLFSIHAAESAAEIEFLLNGTGPFRDFLEQRGVTLDSFIVPGKGAVAYLDSLGVLDDKTLCVHGVHVAEAEIDILAQRRATVCLCPGSNNFLGVGKAPVERYLAQGVPLTLGTDSMASNPWFSLWHEMKSLRQDHPAVSPAQVLAMATGNGAGYLGIADRLGFIAPQSSSSFLAVRCPAVNVAEVLEHLTTIGGEVELEWVE
ncbi:MAG: amidohydrolase family protein [Desulfobulbaceae bacterium]|nr:amidohydrolase family protein [Desulfobulbaceae bacterium]HIJ80021.1 amidohydrolase family protein [Deltaproteobacteria bacterium]